MSPRSYSWLLRLADKREELEETLVAEGKCRTIQVVHPALCSFQE